MTKRERLEQAGIISENAQFTSAQLDAIDSLTDEEVEAIISAKGKLGDPFVIQHCPHNFVF